MAGNTLGSLLVKLGLDSAEFTSGLTKSEYQAKQFADSLSNKVAVGIVKAEIAMRAFGEAAKFAIHAIPELVDQAGKFQDLAEKIGGSAADLASLSVAAKVGGADLDTLGAFAIKAAKNLAGVDDDSKAAGAALKSLGLNIKDFKGLDAVGQFEALAGALKNFKEGSGTAALEGIAKGGAQLLPFLKELGTGVGRVNILTEEQIRLADEYSDRHARSRAELNLYAQAVATDMVPALTAFTGGLTDVIKGLLGTDKAAKGLSSGNAILDFSEKGANGLANMADVAFKVGAYINGLARNIGGAAAAMNEVLKGNFSRAGTIVDDIRADNRGMVTELGLAKAVAARFKKIREEAANAGGKDDRPPVPYKGANEDGAAVLKKTLDGQLKLVRDFAEQQKTAYEFANQYLKGVYDDGVTSLADFFDKQRAVRDAGLQAQVDALNKEIALLDDYRKKASKPQERIDAENKIAEAVQKRASIIQRSGQQNILAAQEEEKAFKQLAFSYFDFLSAVKESQGDQVGAAAIRLAKERQANQELLTKVGFDPEEARRQAGAQADRLLSQTKLNVAQSDYARLVESSGIKEQEALLAGRLAGESELETLTKITGIRQGALGALGDLVIKAKELADQLDTPEARLFADRMAQQFRQATAEAEPLLLKLRDLGKEMGDSIAGGLADAIVQGKGLRETLVSIERKLLDIVLNDQFTKPLGMFLSNAIGGNGTSAGGGGILGNLFGNIFGRSGAPAADTTGWSIGLPRAGGGQVQPNSLQRVNELGPELLDVNGRQFLMMGNQRGQVTPMAAAAGGDTIIFNVTVPAGTPNATAEHIAAEANRRLANRRNL